MLWADLIRVRAGLAHGRWRGRAAAAPRPPNTAANRSIVTVLFYAPPMAASRVRVYGGAGASHYLTNPWFRGPLARRFTAGAEGTWRAWAIGAEWELEKGDRQTMRDTLTARVGIAIRRSF